MITSSVDTSLLPRGPGLLARWVVAVPLMVLSTALPMFAQLVLNAWDALSVTKSAPVFGEQAPDPGFWSEIRDSLDTAGQASLLPGIVLLVFLLRGTMFPDWPKVCLWLGLLVLGPVTFLMMSMSDAGGSLLPNLAFVVGFVWLSYELGRLTLAVMSRPIARDLALSRLDIPYPVPGSRVRLRIRHDRLRLDRLKSANRDTYKDIRWAELEEVRLDELDEPMSWQANSFNRVSVPAGPVLRVAGADEEWVLPVTEALGEDLAAAITLRVNSRT